MTLDSAGGKAAGLVTAEKCGLPVPSWTVIPSELFTAWADRADVFGSGSGVGEATMDLASNEAAQQRVLARAEACPLTEAEAETIEAVYRSLGVERVAVRSSGIEEDGAHRSYAGVYLTTLNASTAAEVVSAVWACWVSAFTPRALCYRARRAGSACTAGMAVILQDMVGAHRSGVLFTRDPSNPGAERAVVSCVYGLGEGLVSGTVDADTIYVDSSSGDVVETHVGGKDEAVVARAVGSGTALDPVEPARRELLALSADEVRAIWRAGADLEKGAGCPQDVEWAYDQRGTLWILQSRPITTLQVGGRGSAAREATLRLWDNSNVIESFGAVTAPLTFSFAQHVYYRVYREYARLLGVPERELDAMDPWLRNMLGWFDGHVYYNLLNWYRVIRLLPSYRTNRRVLELQMGLSEPLDEELALAQQPLAAHPVRRAAVRTWIAGNFVLHFLRMHRTAAAFVTHFDERFHRFEDGLQALGDMGAAEIFDLYQHLEHDLLRRFGRMILLEATVAMSYGAFQTLLDRWLPDTPGWARWEAVRPRRPMASSTAVETLDQIATYARGRRPEVLAALRDTMRNRHEALSALGEHDLLAMVDDFIGAYGYRSGNELKLEAPDMRDDPEIFFDLLRGTLDAQEADRPRATSDDMSETTASSGFAWRLRGPRRWLLDRARRKVQVSLEDREDVRFCRSRAFGMVRRMMTAIGNDLTRVGALDDASDVFYLQLDELEKYVHGAATASELAPLVALRRAEFAAFPTTPGRSRFITRGAPYWGQIEDGYPRDGTEGGQASGDGSGEFRGTGCVPGVAEGRVEVLDAPRDVAGGILVAYRTDPGWITMLPTARGVVIERGSPLTHVAIAAREFGIPTVVQVPGITGAVGDGDWARVDGKRGTVTTRSGI